ncbi:SWIM zinc finger family protein [Thermocatellispora tengchongensis]|uniref:SWIM zinc finger family protein n=1 Tax=Thermocatellispora tengchongensis TaxID=1073253 RepID=UPI003629F8F3
MIERWSREQVLALAPDDASQKAAQKVAAPAKWSGAGAAQGVVWGSCAGSGATPYQVCVDLSGPAYRCGCPSRKFPCKHALGLLLLWSADGLPAGAAPPAWVAEWLSERRPPAASAQGGQAAGAGHTPSSESGEAADRPRTPSGSAGGGEADGRRGQEAARRAEQREQRVAAGLSELERWLSDQIRQGIAGTRAAGSGHWDGLAKRLVDAQAPGVAGTVARLAPLLVVEEEWPSRVLEEYALLHLLAVAHRAGLEGPLRETVRTRVGFPVGREEVVSRGERVRDHWHVLGSTDTEQDRLVARRVWLRGARTGRPALVLSFAPIGRPLDSSLVVGTCVDADLSFYPGAAPLRAQVAAHHGWTDAAPPAGVSVPAALGEIAAALAADPWVDSWPLLLEGVVPLRAAGDRAWLLGHPSSPAESWPLHPRAGTDPWRLVAVSGGHPVTVAAEWRPRGLTPWPPGTRRDG